VKHSPETYFTIIPAKTNEMEISNFIFVLQKYLLSGRTVTLTFPSEFIMIFYQFVELSGSGFIYCSFSEGMPIRDTDKHGFYDESTRHVKHKTVSFLLPPPGALKCGDRSSTCSGAGFVRRMCFR
jgi:hypothetical protein